ncbi:MAG: SAM-dependent methyltransferase [Waterburya sp.]
MSENQDFVSRTSLYIAAMRAFETERSDRLFEDPFAADLAGSEIMTKIKQWAEDNDESFPSVTLRVRFFDDFLLRVNSNIEQVVMLGAGMDTRAFRLPLSANTNFYELDRAEVLEQKDVVLKDVPAKCNRYAIAADLEKHWQDKLIAQGYQADSPSIWLLEGLIYYLQDSEVNDLLQAISDLSANGSWIGADVMNKKMIKEPDSWSKYWHFGCDNPEELFAEYGWKASVAQPGDENTHYDRFRKTRPPREVPDVTRLFFVTAEKTAESGE